MVRSVVTFRILAGLLLTVLVDSCTGVTLTQGVVATADGFYLGFASFFHPPSSCFRYLEVREVDICQLLCQHAEVRRFVRRFAILPDFIVGCLCRSGLDPGLRIAADFRV